MTRIIHYKKPAPFDGEYVYVTVDQHFDVDVFFGDDVEIISDETYEINLDVDFPTDKELAVEE